MWLQKSPAEKSPRVYPIIEVDGSIARYAGGLPSFQGRLAEAGIEEAVDRLERLHAVVLIVVVPLQVYVAEAASSNVAPGLYAHRYT